MGVCQNVQKIKSKSKRISNNQKIMEDKKIFKNNKIIIPDENLSITNTTKKTQEEEHSSKLSFTMGYSNKYYETSPSNISSNSTCVQTNPLSKPQNFTIEATIGEIEIPIIVEKKEKIIIKINQNIENNKLNKNNDSPQNKWSFLKDENPVNYLGHNNYKYKNINIGALLMRISGDKKIYCLDKLEKQIIANNKGNLLFFANLDNSDYNKYEPKGSLSISILGGNYVYDNELFYSYNINCFSNICKPNYDSKEYKILYYINKARNNIKKFFNDYYSLNDNINQEFKDFLNNSNINKKSELKMCKELNDLALKHCEDLCENETAGHTSTDGLNLKSRFDNYYKTYYFGESIIYNINNPLFIVKNLIEDKYSKKKKNRKNLFFNQFQQVGICIKEHSIYKFCCIIVFSE